VAVDFAGAAEADPALGGTTRPPRARRPNGAVPSVHPLREPVPMQRFGCRGSGAGVKCGGIIAAAVSCSEWTEAVAVLLGRAAAYPDANAEVAKVSGLLQSTGGFATVGTSLPRWHRRPSSATSG